MLISIATGLALLSSSCSERQSSHLDNGGRTDENWVVGYYRASQTAKLPPEKINFDAVTHLLHFSLEPTAEGTLISNEGLTPEASRRAVAAAHAAGRKIILTVGGWATHKGFRGAIASGNQSELIEAIVTYMTAHNYDGVDIDWEPMDMTDRKIYPGFIKALRARLDRETPRPLLAAATQWHYEFFTSLRDDFDRINLMTYDLNGAWDGTEVAHHSALLGPRSVTSEVAKLGAAGIPPHKIGIGLAFYGYYWKEQAKLGEPWSAAAIAQTKSGMPTYSYNHLMENILPAHGEDAKILWDVNALAPYIVVDKDGTEDDLLISYENEASIKAKLRFVEQQGLGGVIIWSLDKDVMKDGSTPLLNVVGENF